MLMSCPLLCIDNSSSYSGLTDRNNIPIRPATILLKISDSFSVPIFPYLHLNGARELFLRFEPLEQDRASW